jgi:hypothetical protein
MAGVKEEFGSFIRVNGKELGGSDELLTRSRQFRTEQPPTFTTPVLDNLNPL